MGYPVGYVVFADGKAGIYCGQDEDGNDLVAWVGKVSAVKHDVDEKGDGTRAFETQYQASEKK